MIMYKQFRQKNGKLYPLFVLADEETPVGVWLTAKEGPRNEKGKVKSKLGGLAYRPGWHLSEIPYAPHIGLKDEATGRIAYMHPNTVWAECEVFDGHDYTKEAAKKNARDSYLRHLPHDGYYYYNTNPQMVGRWVIADKIKVRRVLTDAETDAICMKMMGIHAQPRKIA